jgi:2,3-bisphosphoglycerate-independent phosphoglycerate mutase
MIYSSRDERDGVSTFSEESAASTGLYIPAGHTLMERFIEK